jgi:hypothetical protein
MKLQRIVRACGESMEGEWEKDSSNELGFRPLYSMTRKLHNTFVWPTSGGLTHT